jgi:hypothetical protein
VRAFGIEGEQRGAKQAVEHAGPMAALAMAVDWGRGHRDPKQSAQFNNAAQE